MVNGLQLIIHLSLFNLIFPPNVLHLFSLIADCLAMNIEAISNFVTNLVPDPAAFTDTVDLSSSFQNMSYSNTNISANLGSLLIYIVVLIVLCGILAITGWLGNKCGNRYW